MPLNPNLFDCYEDFEYFRNLLQEVRRTQQNPVAQSFQVFWNAMMEARDGRENVDFSRLLNDRARVYRNYENAAREMYETGWRVVVREAEMPRLIVIQTGAISVQSLVRPNFNACAPTA